MGKPVFIYVYDANQVGNDAAATTILRILREKGGVRFSGQMFPILPMTFDARSVWTYVEQRLAQDRIKLSEQQIVIGGRGTGAAIAQEFAERHAEQVIALIVVDAGAREIPGVVVKELDALDADAVNLIKAAIAPRSMLSMITGGLMGASLDDEPVLVWFHGLGGTDVSARPQAMEMASSFHLGSVYVPYGDVEIPECAKMYGAVSPDADSKGRGSWFRFNCSMVEPDFSGVQAACERIQGWLAREGLSERKLVVAGHSEGAIMAIGYALFSANVVCCVAFRGTVPVDTKVMVNAPHCPILITTSGAEPIFTETLIVASLEKSKLAFDSAYEAERVKVGDMLRSAARGEAKITVYTANRDASGDKSVDHAITVNEEQEASLFVVRAVAASRRNGDSFRRITKLATSAPGDKRLRTVDDEEEDDPAEVLAAFMVQLEAQYAADVAAAARAGIAPLETRKQFEDRIADYTAIRTSEGGNLDAYTPVKRLLDVIVTADSVSDFKTADIVKLYVAAKIKALGPDATPLAIYTLVSGEDISQEALDARLDAERNSPTGKAIWERLTAPFRAPAPSVTSATTRSEFDAITESTTAWGPDVDDPEPKFGSDGRAIDWVIHYTRRVTKQEISIRISYARAKKIIVEPFVFGYQSNPNEPNGRSYHGSIDALINATAAVQRASPKELDKLVDIMFRWFALDDADDKITDRILSGLSGRELVLLWSLMRPITDVGDVAVVRVFTENIREMSPDQVRAFVSRGAGAE